MPVRLVSVPGASSRSSCLSIHSWRLTNAQGKKKKKSKQKKEDQQKGGRERKSAMMGCIIAALVELGQQVPALAAVPPVGNARTHRHAVLRTAQVQAHLAGSYQWGREADREALRAMRWGGTFFFFFFWLLFGVAAVVPPGNFADYKPWTVLDVGAKRTNMRSTLAFGQPVMCRH